MFFEKYDKPCHRVTTSTMPEQTLATLSAKNKSKSVVNFIDLCSNYQLRNSFEQRIECNVTNNKNSENSIKSPKSPKSPKSENRTLVHSKSSTSLLHPLFENELLRDAFFKRTVERTRSRSSLCNCDS